ncbi:MAG: Sec-independent protein translocase subunit TatA/TatB, partial [Terriglobales bacterium]
AWYHDRRGRALSMSFGELLFLLILALLVFGPRKLPEIARTVAKVMTDLRRASNEFRYTLEEEIHKIEVTEHPAPSQRLEVVPARVEGTVAQEPEPPAAKPQESTPPPQEPETALVRRAAADAPAADVTAATGGVRS